MSSELSKVMTPDFIRQIRKVLIAIDAAKFAMTTTRPAFREIIDNLQWGDIR